MKTLQESIAASMDAIDLQILPYLPYILQDFQEIGTTPDIIIETVRKYIRQYSEINFLDLGCGKGTVSIELAATFGCRCLGIDGIQEFIDEAQKMAKGRGVDTLCTFEAGDLRPLIAGLSGFDIALLGSTGPIFGDYYSTLARVSKSLKKNGLIILADGYIEDASSYTHPMMVKKQELLRQAGEAGVRLIDEIFSNEQEDIEEAYDEEFEHLEQRCRELMKRHPHKGHLFQDYIRRQKEEYAVLKRDDVLCPVMVFDKTADSVK